MKKIISILFLAVLVSCSPQKRLNRLLKRHPELLSLETVTYRDTVVFQSFRHDTIFSTNFDTLVINTDRFEIELIKNDSLIYLSTLIKGDTIFIEKQIPVEKIKVLEQKKENTFFSKALLFMLVFSLLLLIIYTIFRR